jgi:HlyD family secretion protein
MFGLTWKRIIVVAIVLLAVAAAAWALRPQPVPVDIAVIGSGPLEVTVEDEATTRIRDVYTVSAPVGGKTQRSPRRVGDSVQGGRDHPRRHRAGRSRVSRHPHAARQRGADRGDAGRRSISRKRRCSRRRRSSISPERPEAAHGARPARDDLAARPRSGALRGRNGGIGLASAEATLEVRRRELASAEAGLIQPGGPATESATCCINVMAPIDGQVLRVHRRKRAGGPGGRAADRDRQPGRPRSRRRSLVARCRACRTRGDGAHHRMGRRRGVRRPRGARGAHRHSPRSPRSGSRSSGCAPYWNSRRPRRPSERLGHNYRVVARVAVWQAEDVVTVPLGALFRDGDSWAVFVVRRERGPPCGGSRSASAPCGTRRSSTAWQSASR